MKKIAEYVATNKAMLTLVGDFLTKINHLVIEADRNGFLLPGTVVEEGLKVAWLVAPSGTLPGRRTRAASVRSARQGDNEPVWMTERGKAVDRINYEFCVRLRQPAESSGPVVSVCLEVDGPEREFSWWEVKRLIRKYGWKHLVEENGQLESDLECGRLNLTESTTPEAVRNAVMAAVDALRGDFEATAGEKEQDHE